MILKNQEKPQFYSIMSEKEKEYISNIFIKNMTYKGIDYSNIFANKKIVVEDKGDEKSQISPSFAKQVQRSRKNQRESIGSSKSAELNGKINQSQVYDTLTILKHVEMKEETRVGIENDLCDFLISRVNYFDGFTDLFETLFSIFNQKCLIFTRIIPQFHKNLEKNSKFKDFLDSKVTENFKITQIDEETMVKSQLLSTEAGIDLMIFIIIKNKQLSNELSQVLLISTNIAEDYENFKNLVLLLYKFGKFKNELERKFNKYL
ncbi:hypothetical protein NUSPORA_02185 [Nucleospora cyclopteri]